MEKHFVGSEIGQLRSVMLHRPNLSLKRLTPSNCQELLFDDVLSVERAGEEHDIFANTLRQQGIEVLLLTDLLTQTLDVADAKAWLLDSHYRITYLPVTRPAGYITASQLTPWRNLHANVKRIIYVPFIAGILNSQAVISLNISATRTLITTTPL